MEFLLINHPLDCPICDQGGECDLQDQAMAYGKSYNRFVENKRAIEDKYIGPLVKTEMTRCIQCTRCVRFTTEVGGVEELGATGRGEDMEITTYLDKAMTSELQGNVIDLCPVGALTSAPYEFKARPWELRKTDTIDAMDAVGSNIRVDARGSEVMRILPRTHEDVNEEWISDKTRFVWDGLKTQRLDRPYIREFGKLRAASWSEAFARIAQRVKAAKPERMGVILGDLVGAEEAFSWKQLATSLGIKNIDCRQDGTPLGEQGGRAGYLFNSSIAGIEEADAIMLIGTNPRLEAPVLNARIRKRILKGGCIIGVIGEKADLTYKYHHMGAGAESLATLAEHALAKVQKPMFIIGQARPFWPLPPKPAPLSASSRKTGTALTFFTLPQAVSARLTFARFRARAVRIPGAYSPLQRRATLTCCSWGALTKSIRMNWLRLLWSIWELMAMRELIVPM
jgi:NADH-quinone oxidoreductase subunit G